MKPVILALVSIALFGCGRPDKRIAENQPVAGSPVPGDWAVVRFPNEPDNLNPIIASSIAAKTVLYGMNNSGIFDGLMQYDAKSWSFTKPLLAESYPVISDDHLVYTFTLRDGVKWHDGQPLTPGDILFSSKAMMSPYVDSAPMRANFTDLKDVELLNGRKIRFTFAKPNFMNVVNLGDFLPIVPKHVYDPAGVLDSLSYADIIGPKGRSKTVLKFAEAFNKHAANRAPIGTGPWKFERWDTAREIVLTRNDAYWGPKPYLSRIAYRIIADYTTALTALKSGELDFNPRLLPIQFAQQSSGAQFDSRLQKGSYSSPGFSFIGWNLERPYFKDKRVRQALTMLINRPQIIETVCLGLGKATESPFDPSSPEYNTNLKPYPYDPQRATDLLDQAGWKDTDGDGIRDNDGVPFRFEMLVSMDNEIANQLLPVLTEEFRKAGIDLKERRLEFGVFFGTIKDHKFDAQSAAWSWPLVMDPYPMFHSSSAENRGFNSVNFKNAEADQILEQARTEFDAEKRKELYWRLQEIIYDEQPYTFLFANRLAAAWDKRFQNVRWYPPTPGYDLTEWFVPKSLQKFGALKPD